MPHSKSAIKSMRKDAQHHLTNMARMSEVKTYLKKFIHYLDNKEYEKAREFFKQVSSKLDKAASKKIISKNSASRKKSRLSRQLRGHNT